MSGWLAELQFLRPQWLWALAAAPLLLAGWHLRRRRSLAWRHHVDAHLLPHVIEPGLQRSSLRAPLAGLAGFCLAVLALAGPSWRAGEATLQQAGRPLVIALDLSDPILAADLPPSRLLQARAALAELLRARSDGEVGLLVFSADAYTVSPLTADAANVAIFLDALSPELMPEDGHRPDRAIEAAVRLLEQAGHRAGDILLLTHEADARSVAAASRAAAAGFRVSSLGLGTDAGAAYRGRDGSVRSSRLDTASLRRVASAGGGGHAALRAGTTSIEALVPAGGNMGSRADRATSATVALRDEGYWLLLPLLLLGLFAFRRGSGLAVIVLAAGLSLPVPRAEAAQPPVATAWQRIDQVAHARMREGLAAYRAGRHDEAERLWRDLPGADAAYNRGNALARAGRFEEALAAYDEAMRREPGMEDARANRAIVESAMRRQPPSGQGAPRQREQDGDEGEGAGAAEGEGGASASPGEGQGETASASPPPAGPPADTSRAGTPQATPADAPAPAAADAQAQREADQAQRQRMQDALDAGERHASDGTTVDGAPRQAETEAERERRQATEAWLRRVPDDPGGLLRARFQLEHERRRGGRSR